MPAPEEEDEGVTISQSSALLHDLQLKLEAEDDDSDLNKSKCANQFVSIVESDQNITVSSYNNNIDDGCSQLEDPSDSEIIGGLISDDGESIRNELVKTGPSYHVEETMETDAPTETYFSEPCEEVEDEVEEDLMVADSEYLNSEGKHLMDEQLILCKVADGQHIEQDPEDVLDETVQPETVHVEQVAESGEQEIGHIEQFDEPMLEIPLKTEPDEPILSVNQNLFDSQAQNIEEFDENEQVIETSETELPQECVSGNIANVHTIEETYTNENFTKIISKPYTAKGKSIISKDGTFLELNQLSQSVKKIFPASSVSKISPSLKRPLLPGPGQGKNVITKVIIQGNPNNTGTTGQTFKIIGSPGSSPLVSGPARSLTFAQAQQMGIITPGGKIQHILPGGSGQKRMIVKKIIPTSNANVLSPTKILPAPGLSPLRGNVRPVSAFRGPLSVANVTTVRGVPVTTLKPMPSVTGVTQIRPVPVAMPSVSNLVNIKPSSTVKGVPATQKVIIRQGQIPLKGGTIINPSSSTPVIRIPSQSNFQPIHIGGKQLQYVRFVSAPGSTATTTLVSSPRVKVMRGSTVNLTSTTSSSGFKTIPIAPNLGSNVKTVLPKTSLTSTSGKKILIPVSQGVPQLRLTNSVSTVASESNLPVGITQLKTTQAGSPVSVSSIQQFKTLSSLSAPQLRQRGTSPVKGSTIETLQDKDDGGNLVIVPSELVEHEVSDGEGSEVQDKDETSKNESNEEENLDKDMIESDGHSSGSPNRVIEAFEANGIRMKKPCNCTRSQCLKLYCECFANGEFCYQCNCNNCYNNIEHEEERQKSIRSCLDRNPSAFRPKIQIGDNEEDERRHNKGCHCKRSGCLKNYCECFEAKITCSKFCKCVGCRNTEEFLEGSRSGLIDLADAAEESLNSEQKPDIVLRQSQSSNSIPKQPYNFMSSEVIEATCQCLLAQAEEAVRNDLPREDGERMIIEEFGKCLVQIISCSNVEENNY